MNKKNARAARALQMACAIFGIVWLLRCCGDLLGTWGRWGTYQVDRKWLTGPYKSVVSDLQATYK